MAEKQPVKTMSDELYDLLVCPRCRGKLAPEGDEQALHCETCKLRYPIVDGLPMLTEEDAQPLEETS